MGGEYGPLGRRQRGRGRAVPGRRPSMIRSLSVPSTTKYPWSSRGLRLAAEIAGAGYGIPMCAIPILRALPLNKLRKEPATGNGFRERECRIPRRISTMTFHVHKILIVVVTEGRGAQDMVALVGLRRRIGPIRASHPHTGGNRRWTC